MFCSRKVTLRYRPALEQLEDRLALAIASLPQFLLNMTNLYSISSNPVDRGRPIVPLYTDFQAGGTYGSIDYTANLGPGDLDANDPDAVRGFSSFRMTWDGVTSPGVFQFGLSSFVADKNVPRDITNFGKTRMLRFHAKGDEPLRKLQVLIFQRNGAPSGQLAFSKWLTLSPSWRSYTVKLPVALRPQDLHAVQFLMDDEHDPGGGEVRLDDVRLITSGFDPLRVTQSFLPAHWAPNPPNNPVEFRDLNIFPNRSFLYDVALSAKGLNATGDAAAQQVARDQVDAILATMPNGTVGYFNARNAGHTLLGDHTPRLPFDQLQTLGDNCWFGLALLEEYVITGQPIYLTRAREISDWAEANLKDVGVLKGYRGGFDAVGDPFPWRSVEHNIDAFQLNHLIGTILTDLNDVAAPIYAARATHAGDFVINLYDGLQGKFWTGTGAGDTINMDSVPLDTQFWPILTLAQSPEYANAIDWSLPLAWAEANLVNTDGAFTGFTFSTGVTGNQVWFEGNGIASVSYQVIGAFDKAETALQLLENARRFAPNADDASGGLVAVSSDTLEDPSLGAIYDARLAVAPTAWNYFAVMGINPFDLNRTTTCYLSIGTPGSLQSSSLPPLPAAHADIVRLQVDAFTREHNFSMYFDGSDVGLSLKAEGVDAFTFLTDGTMVVSTSAAFEVSTTYTTAGVGTGPLITGNGEDLLLFTPSQLGSTTLGTWSTYFDGSDVGLQVGNGNIDAIARLSDGRLLLSAGGTVTVPAAEDEDLLAFTPTTLGDTTAGTFALFFDGSDVGLGSFEAKDIDAVFVRESAAPGNPTLFFSTRGNTNVPSVAAANDDAFRFIPTSLEPTTAGLFGPGLTFDGGQFGLAAFNLDGIFIGGAPNENLFV